MNQTTQTKTKPTPFEVLISLTDEQGSSGSRRLVQDLPQPADIISKRALNRFLPFSKQMRLIQSKAETSDGRWSPI